MDNAVDDGGRAAAGYKGEAGDCVCRSVAIASGLPYAEVYAKLAHETGAQRQTKRRGKRSASARNGVNTNRKWFKDYMASIGFKWTPTMAIGQGCKVHLRASELPLGRLVVAVSKMSGTGQELVTYRMTNDSSKFWTRPLGNWCELGLVRRR